MIDLHTVNQAIYDTLEQVAPNTHYVIVLWSDDNKACISSNELDEEIVGRMLSGAAKIVATVEGSYRLDCEAAGHA